MKRIYQIGQIRAIWCMYKSVSSVSSVVVFTLVKEEKKIKLYMFFKKMSYFLKNFMYICHHEQTLI